MLSNLSKQAMSDVKYQLTDSFFARNDLGFYYLIIEVTYLIREKKSTDWKKLFIHYKTLDGFNVVSRNKDYFEIVPNGSLVRRVV